MPIAKPSAALRSAPRFARYFFPAVLAIVLLLTPWGLTPLSPHDEARLAQVLLATLASVTLLAAPALSGTVRLSGRPIKRIVPSICIVLALAACLKAPDKPAALQDAALHLGLVAIAIALSRTDGMHLRRYFERSVALAPLLLGTVIFGVYVASLASGLALDARALHIGFDNPRFLNHAQSVFVPWLVVAFWPSEKQPLWRWLATSAAVMHVALAYLGVARGTAIAWLAACLLLALAGRGAQARRLAMVMFFGLIVGWLAFDALPYALGQTWQPAFANPAEITRAHSRDELWAAALAMSTSSPWLGAGPMQFAALEGAKATHPHNIYLQWAAEYGWPVCILASTLLVGALGRGLWLSRRSAANDNGRLAGLAAACTAALIDGFVSGNFVMPISQIWIALAFGQLLAASRVAGVPPWVTPRPSVVRIAVAAILLASQLGLLAVAARQGLDRDPRLHGETPIPGPHEKPRPRFWLNGQL